ncbi:hypothetical protein ACFXB4_26005 [Streptomyces lavendulae]|uniref:hypothetical protein n=1 Tax=Streptomyces lavendulae TaxID=1914 RepID=UPI0036D1CA75
MAGPTPGPGPAQPPAGGGNIDVKPSSLWTVSGQVAGQQDPMMRGGNTLVQELQKYPDAGGAGTSAEQFAQAYKKIGNRWLEVLGKSVVSIGGVAVGFTETANAYTRPTRRPTPSPGRPGSSARCRRSSTRTPSSPASPTSNGVTTTAATT